MSRSCTFGGRAHKQRAAETAARHVKPPITVSKLRIVA